MIPSLGAYLSMGAPLHDIAPPIPMHRSAGWRQPRRRKLARQFDRRKR